LYLTNDPGHFLPHSASPSIDPCPFPCAADVLARKPARNNINNASPRFSIKGLHIIPYRERFQNLVVLSLGKYTCWVGFPFNGAHCSPSEKFSPKYSATSAREKSQLIHSFSIHCRPARTDFSKTANTSVKRTAEKHRRRLPWR